jgi:RND family efflux transporter MFP subunit
MNLRPAAALAALMAGGLAGCQGDRNAFVAPPPPAVTLGQPAEKPLVDYLQFTGTIRPRETVDLRARVNGYLEKINFTDGAMVNQGDVLFTIEREPIEAELAVAKADLQKAKAQLQLAESELVRYRSLLMRNAATVQEVDVKTAERASAEAAVAAAEATQRQSEIQLGYTEVRAPISGRIGRRLVDVGNLVQAEMTLLGTIESVDPVYVYFTISEDDVLDLARGGSSVLRTGSQEDGIAPELQMALSDEEGYPHIGKLDYADLGVDSDTGTRQYRGVFPNPDRLLVPGLFTRVRTPLADARSRLMVPESALGLDQQGYYVMVVEATERKTSIPAPGGGGAPGGPPPAAKKEGAAAAAPPPAREVPVFVAHRRNVKVGTASEGMLSVESGLEGGETIVVSGLQRVRDGGDIVDNLELAKPPAVAEAPAPPAAARKGG